jgi:hypothetical protein
MSIIFLIKKPFDWQIFTGNITLAIGSSYSQFFGGNATTKTAEIGCNIDQKGITICTLGSSCAIPDETIICTPNKALINYNFTANFIDWTKTRNLYTL